MIPASDLRKGNILNFLAKNGELIARIPRALSVHQILWIDENQSDVADFWEPVPLTPDIYEKCGFVREPNNEYVKDNFVFRKQQNDFILYGFEHDYSGVILIHPVYLHELQNIVYWLSKEELTVNL